MHLVCYRGNPGHSIGWYPPYHLLDTVPLEDVDNTYGESDFQLYNIEEVRIYL